MRIVLLALSAAIVFFWSSPTKAWGSPGHRTVCEIAFRNLTPTARSEVVRLLQADSVITRADPRFKQFSWACTYPDRTVTGGPERRDPEHYSNYARNLASVELNSGCGSAHECVANALVSDYAILRSPFIADRHRAVALMYLGHWIGDVHQPLHNSFADDRGGGAIATGGLCTGGLHSTWDSCILKRKVYAGSNEPDDASLQAVASTWSAEIADSQRAEWLGAPPWQWAAESFAIAIRPEVKYCIMAAGTCRYSEAQDTFSGGSPRTVLIDDAYLDMAAPIAKERIKRAGIRLAHVINMALDPAYRFGF